MNDPQQLVQSFVTELGQAADGQSTSLPFIRHALPDKTIVNAGQTFQVIVAGGSYFQKATIRKTDGQLEILQADEGAQPVFSTKEILFDFLASHLDPTISVLALNFAYPMEPVTRGDILDGKLVRGTKENNFDGLIGEAVGEAFEIYMKEKHDRTLKVACANDTICLLMSGLIKKDANQIAAGIVGTGLNFAIFLDEHTVVNLESSNFDKFEQSESGKAIDAKSLHPGTSIYEKEVAGAYMHQHMNYLIEKRNLGIPLLKSTKLIDVYAQDENEEIARAAQEVLDRAAQLVAAQIAGLLKFCDRDLTFIMQGSVYWKGYHFKESITDLVNHLCPEHHATFEKIEHSDLYGAAKLVA